jgi:hypothetical protein
VLAKRGGEGAVLELGPNQDYGANTVKVRETTGGLTSDKVQRVKSRGEFESISLR